MERCKETKYFIISIIVGIAALKTIVTIFYHIPNELQYSSIWTLGEFLINYQAGFVRRGLIGELIFQTSYLFGCEPRLFIALFCFVCFFAVVIIFFILFHKYGIKWWILPLSIFLANPDIIRKDFFFILNLIAILYCYRSPFRAWIKVIIINSIAIVTILSHEAFFFVCIPLLCLLFIKDKSISNSLFFRFAACVPMLMAMAIACLFHGTLEQAQAIQASWGPLMGEGWNPTLSKYRYPFMEYENYDGSVGALAWSTSFAVKYHLNVNFIAKSLQIPGYIIRPVAIVFLFYFLINYVRLFSSEKISKRTNVFFYLLFFQFCSLLPMFTVLSCDTTRVCMYFTSSTFAFFLVIPQEKYATLFPKWYTTFLDKIDAFITKNRFTKTRYLSIIFLLFIMSAPYIGNNILNSFLSSIIGRYASIIKIVSSFL